MNKLILFGLILSYSISVHAQKNYFLSFSIGNGNSVWQLSKMQIAETNQTGDTLNLYDVDTHANAPSIAGNIGIVYSFGKLSAGLGIGLQHYFINELITDAIYFEESNILAPTSFSSYNNPQPTHVKFSSLFQFKILSNENFSFLSSLKIGTYLTHNITKNTDEGFHWFVTPSFELSYRFNQQLLFNFSSSLDYSRLNPNSKNSINIQDRPYMNIYSFYNSLGVSYQFSLIN